MQILCLHAGHLPPILTESEQNTQQHTRENTKWREQDTAREMALAVPEEASCVEPMSYFPFPLTDIPRVPGNTLIV